jgi:hypothetical protein
MGVRQTAFSSINTFTRGLISTMPERVGELRRRAGGDANPNPWLDDYVAELKLFSDYCLEQRSWETRHSLLPGWEDRDAWERRATTHLNQLSKHWMRCVKSHPAPIAGDKADVEAWLDCMEMLVDNKHRQVTAELLIALKAKADETMYAVKRQSLTAVQKYLVPAITAGLAVIGTLVVKHFTQ